MSMFQAGLGARAAFQTLPVVEAKSKSGWDNFLSGTAQFAGNYLRGLATGLAAYQPGNEFSSFAGAILGSTQGLQAQLDAPVEAFRSEQATKRSVADMMAKGKAEQEIYRSQAMTKAQTAEDIYRSQSERASAMPDIGGMVAGIAQRPTAQQVEEPFGIKIGYGQTAAARTLGLVK